MKIPSMSKIHQLLLKGVHTVYLGPVEGYMGTEDGGGGEGTMTL